MYYYFDIIVTLTFHTFSVDSKVDDEFAEIAGNVLSKLHYIASVRKDLVRYR